MSRLLIATWAGELETLARIVQEITYKEPVWQTDSIMRNALVNIKSSAESMVKHLDELEESNG